jgi:nucleoside-diphosphate-sugar epimerase
MPVLLERALVSGAGGFVGSALVAHLAVTEAPLRMGAPDWTEQLGTTNFEDATIFHLAARVHGDDDDDPGFLHDNVDKTLALARAARRGGARRFVFLSSVKVNGEESRSHAFNRADKPAPQDAYARSKAQAEAGLAMIEGLDVVVVRSPLVYGPGVKGNLLALLRLCDSPWPLPFGALDNRRSFVHVDDLARLLIDCATHPDAAGRTYFAAHERGARQDSSLFPRERSRRALLSPDSGSGCSASRARSRWTHRTPRASSDGRRRSPSKTRSRTWLAVTAGCHHERDVGRGARGAARYRLARDRGAAPIAIRRSASGRA